MPAEKTREGFVPATLARLAERGLGDLALALPPLAILALFLYWAADEGGFLSTTWYPGALLALWLLVICAGDARFSLQARGCRTAALGLLALFTAWSFLSITWATVEGNAWDGANKALLYLVVYAIFSRWSTNARIAASFAALFGLGVAVIGYVTIERALQSGGVASILVDWRLMSPIGYQNGNAALFLIPLWPVLYLASRRELPALARGLLAAGAGFLVQITVLAQSRGSMYAFPIVFLIFIALSDGRGRALATALGVLGLSTLNLGRLLEVYRAGDRGGDVSQAMAQARTGMLLVCLSIFVLMTVIALSERRIAVEPAFARRLDLGFVGGFAAALVIASAIAVGFTGNPIDRAETAWHNFRSGSWSGSSSSHFTSFYGTNRYDFWRVSLAEFREHPVGGIGAGNFAPEYLLERRSAEEPTDPHSLEFKMLLQTGIIGALLFAGFLGCGIAVVRWKDVDPFRKGLVASLVTGFAYWLVHGSVEWFWEIPVLTAVALAFLGLATSLVAGKESDGSAEDPPKRGRRGRLVVTTLALAALAASASFGAPWLSARYVENASRSWRAQPDEAYRMLDRARSLDRLSDKPDVIAGTIAGRRRDFERMKSAFGRALERDDTNWYSWFELGVAQYLTGERPAALANIERARTLNPHESVIGAVLRRARAGNEIDLEEIDRTFLERARSYAPGEA